MAATQTPWERLPASFGWSPMLVLSRKQGEKILIGEKISVTVVRIAPGIVRIGVEAPEDLAILREELITGTHASLPQNGSASSPDSKSPT